MADGNQQSAISNRKSQGLSGLPITNLKSKIKLRRRPGDRAAAASFTLVEVLVAISISSMLFLSLSAALSGTLDTTADVSQQFASWQTVSSALLRMEKEVSLATQFATTGLRQVSFSVPDITGDGADDLVQYSWSGTVGAPLTRTVNGAGSINVLPQAQDVKFSYNYRQKTFVGITNASKDLAVTPAYFTDYDGYWYDVANYDVRSSSWRAESFMPVTDCHRTDSVTFRARTTALFGMSDMSIALTDKATGRTMATGTLSKYDPQYYSTRTFTVPMTWQDGGGSGLSAEKEYRWIFKPSDSSYAGDVEAFRIPSGPAPDNGAMYEYSTNGGATYLNLGNQADIRFITNGTYTVRYGTNTTQTQSLLRRVDVYLKYGTGKGQVAINSGARTANM